MKRVATVVLLLLLSTLLSGCAAVLVGGAAATGMAVHDRRSFGTVVDDNVLEIRVRDAIFGEAEFDSADRVKINAHNGWVLLAGEARDEARVKRAGEIAEGVDGVRRVINELAPHPRVSVGQGSRDRWLSSRVNGRMTRIRGLPGFDATRVKVTTARSTVYLMGLVTEQEAEAVLDHVRTIAGVERVVTVFEYIDAS